MRGYQAIDEETRNTLTDAIANIQVGNETLFDDITSYLDSRLVCWFSGTDFNQHFCCSDLSLIGKREQRIN